MNKRYTHLTQEARYQIWLEKKVGISNEVIAQDLGRNLSTISLPSNHLPVYSRRQS
jgi:IS30 family transposase